MKYLPLLLLAGCLTDHPAPVTSETHESLVTKPVVEIKTDPNSYVIKQGGITIMADAGWGGSIISAQYYGYELVDMFDHGREIQSALSFDDLGECYNPTEAGRYGDISGSQSEVLDMSVKNNVLHTITDAAFWLPPGMTYFGQRCGTAVPYLYEAQNHTDVGGYLIEKTVQFDGPNSLRFDLSYTVPNFHEKGTFEFTGYLQEPYQFFYTFNPATGVMADLKAGETVDIGEQPLPVILTNHTVAMGVYAKPDNKGGPGFGRWKFYSSRVNKWNVVWRERKIQPGTIINRTAWVCIGTERDVMQCLTNAYRKST